MRLKDRPTKKKDYIQRLLVVPTNGLFNKNFKTSARQIGIVGTENAIIRQLIEQQHNHILYRVLPHTTVEWYTRIAHTIRDHDLLPLTELEVSPLFTNPTPTTPTTPPTHTAPNPSPTAHVSVEMSVQTNIAVTQTLALLNQIRNDLKLVNVTLKDTITFDLNVIQNVRQKLNKIKEDIAILAEVEIESNVNLSENLRLLNEKMNKVNKLYEQRENKSRSDVLKYIRAVDDCNATGLTNQEREIIEQILEIVNSYQRLFGDEFPEDVEHKILNLKKAVSKKRKNEEALPSTSKHHKSN